MTVRRRLALSMAALMLLSGASAMLSVRARERTTAALADLQAGQQRLERLLALDREVHLRWRELSVVRELSPTSAQLHVLGTRLDALDRLVGELAPASQAQAVAAAYTQASTTWRAALADL